MDERSFYTELTTTKPAELNCPHCKTVGTYELPWMVRRKKDRLPGHADERDKARFAKAQSYMVLAEDKVACSNLGCRKRFDISGVKTMAFLSPEMERELSDAKPQRQDRRDSRPQRSNQGGGQQRGYKKKGRGQGGNRSQGGQGGKRGQGGNRGKGGNRGQGGQEPDGNRWYGGQGGQEPDGNRWYGEQSGQGGQGRGGNQNRRQQKKGKKKKPEVYFPSDYVNYRP